MITGIIPKEHTGFGDCWADSISLDETLIEQNKCPKCKANLTYKGFSNANSYFAFGVCETCEFAKLFWTNCAAVARGKKLICRIAA